MPYLSCSAPSLFPLLNSRPLFYTSFSVLSLFLNAIPCFQSNSSFSSPSDEDSFPYPSFSLPSFVLYVTHRSLLHSFLLITSLVLYYIIRSQSHRPLSIAPPILCPIPHLLVTSPFLCPLPSSVPTFPILHQHHPISCPIFRPLPLLNPGVPEWISGKGRSL